MKKIIILSAACATGLFYSCTEKGSLSLGSGSTLSDTTFVASTESPEKRMVFVEEATGVKCPNCPAGAALLKKADSLHPDRIVVVGLHAGSLTSPISGESKYNFQTDFAKQLQETYFGGDPNKPAAVFDRTKDEGTYFVSSRNKWLSIIENRLALPPSLNLSVSTAFNDASNEVTLTVRGAYTAAVAKKQNLTIMVTEDGIIDAQKNEEDKTIPEYEHNHVLRDMLTTATGDALLNEFPTKEAGRVFVRIYKYQVPKDKGWNVDNMHVLVVVHNNEGEDKEVQQAAEVKLKP
ncbi:MAG TPA: Omp28-related outer membrane protein [Flavipsychrobacter sp.]|nr:Omp28-related outer membrane protein [Flavipsychrobacter sp.]